MDGKEIARLFELNAGSFALNLAEVSDAGALERRGDAGSINWVAGHVLGCRRSVFKLAGLEMPWTLAAAEVYGRGSSPAALGAAAVPLSEIAREYRESQVRLLLWLGEVSVADLGAALPEGPHELLGKSIGDALTFYAWHEGYHVGQLGILRRGAGLKGAIP